MATMGSGWFGWLSVATCRQTVEGFYSAVHRLAADGYVGQRVVRLVVGSHLSPDGGGFLLRRPPLGSGWLRWAAVATARQTVEV
jgi:hypothetical protein